MVNYGLYRLINVQPGNNPRVEKTAINLIAAHIQDKTPITPPEQDLLAPVLPTTPWPYNCYRNSQLLFSKSLDKDYLARHSSQLLRLALDLTLRNPDTTINHFACNGAFTYRVFTDGFIFEGAGIDMANNPYGMKLEPLLPGAKTILDGLHDATVTNHGLYWFFWRSPFWMYLLSAGILLYCLRGGSWNHILIMIPSVVIVGSLYFLSLGQIFRYVYPIFLTGTIFSFYYLSVNPAAD
jgi:hypothetical protein